MIEMFEEAGETILWFLVGDNTVPPAVCVEKCSMVRLGKEAGTIQTRDGGRRSQTERTGLVNGSVRVCQDNPRFGT